MLHELLVRSCRNYVGLPVLSPVLEQFTEWAEQQGYALGSVRNTLRDTRQVVSHFQAAGIQCCADLTHKHFDRAWEHFHCDRPNIASAVHLWERFLADSRRLAPPLPGDGTRTDRKLEEFSAYLTKVRGLAKRTVHGYVSCLKRFLLFISFDTEQSALRKLTSTQIDGFVTECAKTRGRHSLQHVVGYLRTFLKFEYHRGAIRNPIHEAIDTPRIYRLERLPRSVSWATVQEFLRSFDRTEPQGIRDYAMLLLVATCGLRPCEVVGLRLEDIDWRRQEIRIAQQKTGSHLVLPLPDSVGVALIDYLKKGRPRLPHREVFLRLRAPYGRLGSTAVTEVFQRQVRRSDLDIPHYGCYCLRHSYAVHLLRQGTSVKLIGDLLGHRQAESTCVYLRLEIDDLRKVALEVPGRPDRAFSLVRSTPSRKATAAESLKQAKSCTPRKSFLAEAVTAYLEHHRSLGKAYQIEAHTLHCLDAFLASAHPEVKDLNGRLFDQWCDTFADLTPTVRRNKMRIVRNFCLYRMRSHPHCFVPDTLTFPTAHLQFTPHILSPSDIGRLVAAADQLSPWPKNPLRAEVIRLGIILLYTCGLRRGELLRLILADYNSVESTILIRSTKFHKERLIPLSPTADVELRAYLELRQRCGLPIEETSPIIMSKADRGKATAYTGPALVRMWRRLCTSLNIITSKRAPPRVHDIRHSFAVNALIRWYEEGQDVQAKLPQLSTFMGHVSVVSTQCYLPFIEPLRSAANTLFEQKYSVLIPDETASEAESCGPEQH